MGALGASQCLDTRQGAEKGIAMHAATFGAGSRDGIEKASMVRSTHTTLEETLATRPGEAAAAPPRSPRLRRTPLGWARFVVGFSVCLFVMLLPYRLRIAAGERIGLFLNFLYDRYLRLLSWLFRRLSER